jgi:hypothetical protein
MKPGVMVCTGLVQVAHGKRELTPIVNMTTKL